MATPKVIPISQKQLNQNHVPLIVSYTSADQKKSIAQLKLNNDQKIQDFIQANLMNFESLKDSNAYLYGLRLISSSQYINEGNRTELLATGGNIRFHEVELCFNLETEVKSFIEKITSLKISTSAEAVNQQLISVQKYIEADKLFASVLFAKGGKRLMIDYIKESDKLSDAKKWQLLYNMYRILVMFIQKWRLTTWDRSEIDLPVIQLICDILNEGSKDNKKYLVPDELILLFLEIVDDILNSSEHTRELVLRDLKFGDVIFLIQRQNSKIKETLLTLLNNVFKESDNTFKQNLFLILSQPQQTTLFREELLHVLIEEGTMERCNGIERFSIDASYLRYSLRSYLREYSVAKDDKYNSDCILKNFEILQKNILDIDLGKRLKTPADSSYSSKLQFIISKAFETSTDDKVLTDVEKYTRLGFITPENPLKDFMETPGGCLLPLDFMYYFAEKPAMRQTLYGFASEKLPKNSDYSFPFAKASTSMIKLLSQILRVDDKSDVEENFQVLYLIFTLNNDGIMEFFAKCLCLFARIWSEMKAQSLDFDRALFALRDSLYKIASDANKKQRAYFKRVEYFNNNIEMWKYDNLKTGAKNDKSNREPIKQVEQILTEEVIQMIKPRRMNVLIKGERFDKIQSKDRKPTKQKQTWKLSSDHRFFTVTDYSNDEEINTTQIEVDQIKAARKEDFKNRQYFALNISGEVTFLLGSPREEVIDAWLEGFDMLINSKPSPNIACFVNCLTDTQLLDLQTLGFDIPQDIPKVPELPSDFQFQYIQV